MASKKSVQPVLNEVQKEIQDLRRELQGLQLEHTQFKLKNTSLLSVTRKKLARALTKMNLQRKEEQVNV
jgi:ribosomal protein L29